MWRRRPTDDQSVVSVESYVFGAGQESDNFSFPFKGGYREEDRLNSKHSLSALKILPANAQNAILFDRVSSPDTKGGIL